MSSSPLAHAHRLVSTFPDAALIDVPLAKTWLPIDNPSALANAIAAFLPACAG